MQALRKDKLYTYDDYCKWEDAERCELIDGEIYGMAPAPMWTHQDAIGNLYGQLWQFLKGKPCKVFTSPFDVRLNASTRDNTVLQPDIVVICDRSKLKGTGCVGAPDMVIEILSTSTKKYDREDKFDQYLQAKVREYWIVDPDSNTVTVNILDDKRYCSTDYCETDKAPVHVLEGCIIDLADVFAG